MEDRGAGNGHWTAGEQLQQDLKVPAEGARIHGLAFGTYRVLPMTERFPHELPATFEIDEREVRRTFQVTVAAKTRVRLLVLDRFGLPSGRATALHPQPFWKLVRETWVQQRRPVGAVSFSIEGGHSSSSIDGDESQRPQHTGGFLSRADPGSSRAAPFRWEFNVRAGPSSLARVAD